MQPLLKRVLDMLDEQKERSFLITDPKLEDNPIVFANDAFLRLTGYSRKEVIGRNCRFLQGKDTEPTAVRAIHEAVAQGNAIIIRILNYRKDGAPFWNLLQIRPVRSESGKVDAFVGLQQCVTASDDCVQSADGTADSDQAAVSAGSGNELPIADPR